jgi:hypothetical protein
MARYSRPQDYLLTPSQTIPWEIQQQQLIQQSEQSANNLAAGVSPTQLAQNAAAISGASNPYSGIGPAISSIGTAMNSPTAFGGSTAPTGYAAGLPYGGASPNYNTWMGGPQAGTYYTPPGYTPRTSSMYSVPAV